MRAKLLSVSRGKGVFSRLTILFVILSMVSVVRAIDKTSVSGVVRDSQDAVVQEANVSLLNAEHAIIGTTKTDGEGRFSFSEVPQGSYLLVVSRRGFAEHRQAVNTLRSSSDNIEVKLQPQTLTEEVTITATPGVVESVETVSQQVNIINNQQIQERARSVVGQVANEEPGVHLQRTSPSIAGIFVRGLTGNKVNIFIDGVRYSNSAQRGGINTFLDLIEPSNLQAVEVLRGPNSAQYGSDALGGSVQFLTSTPPFSTGDSEFHGKFGTYFNSADVGFGSNLSASFGTRNFGLLTNFSGRRINTLRVGDELDSHNAVTRFFGLPSSIVIGDRLPDTAFTQYGGLLKMNWQPREGSHLIASYTRSQQDGGKRFDQLIGGDGNLVADLRNLMLDFFYVRFDQIDAGWFDNLAITYSFNSQREERVNQGGNGNPRSSINHDYERLNTHGISAYASKLLGTRQNFLIGGDYYHDRINSPSFSVNPTSGVTSIRRPRIPDNARYEKGGVYLQDIVDAVPGMLRLVGNIRYSVSSYKARAEDAPLVNGRPLWPSDSLRVDDVTFRAGVVVTPVEGLHFSGNISRGFRAPHLTDLDTLGLTGSGFEVPASEVGGLGATIGTTAGNSAVSTGRPVEQTKSETSLSYEFGARYHDERVDTDLAFFVNEIEDNIAKQALILPPGAVGRQLGTEVITGQNANGAVFVAASTNPVLVRANFDDVRIYGFEHTFDVRVNSDWSAGTVFTYLHARDKRTHLPPNIEGGTPAPEGWLKVRYAPAGSHFWVEPYIHAAYRQSNLSSLDLEDRRTGATRSLGSISNFFFNGATVRGLVNAGADGVFGTADDRLNATGETLAQVQGRVLGASGEPAPLFDHVPGYITFSVRGGFRFAERHEVLIDFYNIGDRNYRGISWGVDAPGRGVYLRYNTRF